MEYVKDIFEIDPLPVKGYWNEPEMALLPPYSIKPLFIIIADIQATP